MTTFRPVSRLNVALGGRRVGTLVAVADRFGIGTAPQILAEVKSVI